MRQDTYIVKHCEKPCMSATNHYLHYQWSFIIHHLVWESLRLVLSDQQCKRHKGNEYTVIKKEAQSPHSTICILLFYFVVLSFSLFCFDWRGVSISSSASLCDLPVTHNTLHRDVLMYFHRRVIPGLPHRYVIKLIPTSSMSQPFIRSDNHHLSAWVLKTPWGNWGPKKPNIWSFSWRCSCHKNC